MSEDIYLNDLRQMYRIIGDRSKAVVKDMIKSGGLYDISYRIFTNEKGYESVFISRAAKIKTS